jgi:Na+/melibiose symporter-like transporter
MTLRPKLFYGVGSVAYGVYDNGFSFFLLLYYQQVLGLDAVAAGTALMIALVLDAVSDPLLGYISDNWHSKWGRRHPFMYFSALPVAICYALIWNPPSGLGQQGLFLYLLCGAILIRTLITLYQIPNTSMVAELTDNYDERTSMLSYRYFFGWYGGLTMSYLAWTVFLPMGAPDAEYSQLNPGGYRILGVVAACVILTSILMSSIGTHRYIPIMKKPRAKLQFQMGRVFRELSQTLANRSFLALLIASVFAAIAGGVGASLNVYMGTFFWELTPSQISYIVMMQFLSAVIGPIVAPLLTRRFGKKRAALGLIVASIVFGPLPILLRLVELFPGNASPWLLPILMGHGLIEVSMVVMIGITTASMVADIAEQNEIRHGRREEGLFFAAISFAAKATSGLGVFVAGIILSLVAFPTEANPGEVDPQIIFNLGVILGPVLMLLYFIAFGFVTRYDISRELHEAHLEMLADR